MDNTPPENDPQKEPHLPNPDEQATSSFSLEELMKKVSEQQLPPPPIMTTGKPLKIEEADLKVPPLPISAEPTIAPISLEKLSQEEQDARDRLNRSAEEVRKARRQIREQLPPSVAPVDNQLTQPFVRPSVPPQQPAEVKRPATLPPQEPPRPQPSQEKPIVTPPKQPDVTKPVVTPPKPPSLPPVNVERSSLRPQPTSAQNNPSAEPPKIIIPAKSKKKNMGCGQMIISAFFASLGLLGVGLIMVALGYIIIARDLPDVRSIQGSSFETATIYDASGNTTLYKLNDPNSGNRSAVPLSDISPYLIDATIATEDVRFYQNPGFDPIGIGRAIYVALRNRDFTAGGGASTITQQVVRNLLLDDDERFAKTALRKIREIILAVELRRTKPADEILELYLNEIYYGNRAYGIEAASQTYFQKPAKALTLAEASLLAGLPQAPAWWDPVTAPELADGRQSEVLALMVQHGKITTEEANAALAEQLAYRIKVPELEFKYPHFILAVLAELEKEYGQQLYRGGYKVYTTIDPAVQDLAEQAVKNRKANFNSLGANNAAMVAIDPENGNILALVGSADFYDKSINGQVDMLRAARQVGSTLKPLVYLAAMEQGFTPATLLWDVPTTFPDGGNPNGYTPKNYDDSFHGPVLVRPALGNSYNIPAVKALEYVGVCNFLKRANAWGINLTDGGCANGGEPKDYGLALALGGGAITPMDMATAYTMLANQGRAVVPHSIAKITDKSDKVIFEYQNPNNAERASAEHTHLINNILSDDNARLIEFGAGNRLNIPGYRVAAKSGTSGTSKSDVRDGWTIGYTPEIVAAVWVGNTNNEPVYEGGSGYAMASPIWNEFMTSYLPGQPDTDWERPANIVSMEVCADSGTLSTPICNNRRQELFLRSQPPLDSSSHFLRENRIDLWTLRVVSDACNDEAQYSVTTFNLLVDGRPDLQDRNRRAVESWIQSGAGNWWMQNYGFSLPLPTLLNAQPCERGTARPRAILNEPKNGENVQGLVQIGGEATAPGFTAYQLFYGQGDPPLEWKPLTEWRTTPNNGGQLAVWDTNTLTVGGPYTIRLQLYGPDNPYTSAVDPVLKETTVVVNIALPTATPQPTETPTETPTPTPSGTATDQPTETVVATATAAPTVATPTIIVPTEPVVEPTAVPVVEPTAVPVVEPTAVPVVEPTAVPVVEPTAVPVVEPTAVPVVEPTAVPVVEPTAVPVVEPTQLPDIVLPTPDPGTADS